MDLMMRTGSVLAFSFPRSLSPSVFLVIPFLMSFPGGKTCGDPQVVIIDKLNFLLLSIDINPLLHDGRRTSSQSWSVWNKKFTDYKSCTKYTMEETVSDLYFNVCLSCGFLQEIYFIVDGS
jgi:hypothetical protein